MRHLHHVREGMPGPKGRMDGLEISGMDAPALKDIPLARARKEKQSMEVTERLAGLPGSARPNVDAMDAPEPAAFNALKEKTEVKSRSVESELPTQEIAINVLNQELAEISKETTRSEVSFFRRFVNGSRDVAAAAGRFAREAGTVLQETVNDSTVVGGALDWGRNMLGMAGKPGERLKTNVVSEIARSVAEIPGAGLKGAWEAGDAIHAKVTGEKFIDDELDPENFKPRSVAVEAFASAAEMLGTLATAAGLGREGSKGIPRELAERAVEAPAYVWGGFMNKALELRGKLSGKNKKEAQALAAELQEIETGIVRDYSPEADWTTNLVGRTPEGSGPDDGDGLLHEEDAEVVRALPPREKIAVIEAGAGMAEMAKFHGGGVVDWGKDSAKAIGALASAVRDWFTPKTPEQKAKVESTEATEILPKASELVTERLEVNAAEATEIIQEAQKARAEFSVKVLDARESYLDLIGKKEARIAKRVKQMNNELISSGGGKEALERDKARLENQIDQYKEKIAVIDQKRISKTQAEANQKVRQVYEEAIATLGKRIKSHEQVLAKLSNPNSKAARQSLEAELTRLNEQADSYESIVEAMDKLKTLPPEEKKESMAA